MKFAEFKATTDFSIFKRKKKVGSFHTRFFPRFQTDISISSSVSLSTERYSRKLKENASLIKHADTFLSRTILGVIHNSHVHDTRQFFLHFCCHSNFNEFLVLYATELLNLQQNQENSAFSSDWIYWSNWRRVKEK